MPSVGVTSSSVPYYSSSTSPSDGTTTSQLEERRLFLTVILALGVIILFLLIALIAICCLYRKPKHRLRMDPDDPYLYDPAISNKHIPVIFAEEMDDMFVGSPVSRPLILSDERPPANPDDYDDMSLPDISNGFARIAYGNMPAPPS